ncbi:MAG: U32 family peptidase [Prevotella sp.]|nr:U32 family peptidase [Prevotella sp.]
MEVRTIELLAPAKNLTCGMAAIDHGADAVYIGADRFGARVAAGNSVDDIAELCRYAHQFDAKVYVTVNTIVYDDELDDTLRLIDQLKAIGVDAILVQDMGVYSRCLNKTPPINHVPANSTFSFHASTQTDNRTIEKVRWLSSLGFSRVVLARELSLQDIRAIHDAVPEVELEVFVHGALCVSYSGQCYASQYCFGRSANRGACAQFCRLNFALEDADGVTIDRPRHWLSLRDMCRIDHLEELLDAGAVSLKIEGRLKDADYVKNVTAAYSQRLNDIIRRSNGRYKRASYGNVTYSFSPDLRKTFNRGFTDYFLHGRTSDVFSPDTPKALGEYVGKVKEIRGNSFTVAGTASFANGDGLCFFSDDRGVRSEERGVRKDSRGARNDGWEERLEGFRVNRVEGNRLFPLKMPPSLRRGMALYRNNDVEFERLMKGQTAVRKIAVRMVLSDVEEGFLLKMLDADTGQLLGEAVLPSDKQQAQKPQQENIVRQLSKLGTTPYECCEVVFHPQQFSFFIPSSQLAELRRSVVEEINSRCKCDSRCEVRGTRYENTAETESQDKNKVTLTSPKNISRTSQLAPRASTQNAPLTPKYPYLYNAANQAARDFYRAQGIADATSLETHPVGHPMLMQCRHCLRYSLGYCRKQGRGELPWREPLYLRLPDGRRFRLEFDCRNCQMNVYGE